MQKEQWELTLLKRVGTEMRQVGLAMARHSRIISLVGTIARALPVEWKKESEKKEKADG